MNFRVVPLSEMYLLCRMLVTTVQRARGQNNGAVLN